MTNTRICENCGRTVTAAEALHCEHCGKCYCPRCAALLALCECSGDLTYYD